MKVLKFMRWIAICAVLICTLFTLSPASAAENVPKEVLDLRKSVVRILCFTADGEAGGTGFAIGSEEPVSYIVTNKHVIENADDIEIMRAKDLFIKASVYVQLPFSDLCILKLDEPLYDTPPVVLVDDKIAETGEAVYSLGFPGAADSLSDSITGNTQDVTLTDGIISSVKSLTLVQGGQPVRILQINAAINHGNSGGPLVNKAGQVIGINSYGAMDSQNINGAISILELIDVLKQKGVSYKSNQTAGAKTEPTSLNWKTIAFIAVAVLVAFGIVFALILLGKRRTKQTPVQGLKLEEYLKHWGGKLPFDMSIQILTPILMQLSQKHAQGLCHLDICPDRILIRNTSQGYLLDPNFVQERNRIVLHPGFAALEQYSADSRTGPWTDVYSLSAILFFMVTGTIPQGVLQRKLEEDTISLVLGGFVLSAENKFFIESGLAINATERPQNALELLHALKIAYSPNQFDEAQGIKPYQENKKSNPVKLSKKKVLTTAAIVLSILIPAAIAGGLIIIEHHYETALSYVDEQKYKDAYAEWTVIPEVYKDTNQLGEYIFANMEIDYKNFKRAKERFAKLGNYRNSSELLQEVDYQEALYWLDRLDFNKSREMFKVLGEYKDSKTKLLEVDYQEALSWLNNQEYEKAHNAFTILVSKKYADSEDKLFENDCGWAQSYFRKGNYSQALKTIHSSKHQGADKKLNELKEKIYKVSKGFYQNLDYELAKNAFSLLESYERSKDYLILCEAHTIPAYNYDNISKLFMAIHSLGSFEDAQDLLISDDFIFYRLEGYWTDGHNYFEFNYDKKDNAWYSYTNLPIPSGSFNIRNGLYIRTKDNLKSLEFFFISENNMKVICYKNNRTYFLERR